MSKHIATIQWSLDDGDFLKGRYSREHTWTFDGGITVQGSPSPSVVPVPFSNPDAIDPEEAFVAAIASCHMLTFLYIASKAGYVVTSYVDHAVGTMAKNDTGAMWVNRVELSPVIIYNSDNIPSAEEIADLHHRAHEECFIANSVKTEIIVVG